MTKNWNTADVRVASKSGLTTRAFHQVDIPEDRNYLLCWGERGGKGEEFTEISKEEVGEVYININANGKNSKISVWKNR